VFVWSHCRTWLITVDADRNDQFQLLRRSVAMLVPGAQALSREEALRLLSELGEVEQRLARLRAELRRPAEE